MIISWSSDDRDNVVMIQQNHPFYCDHYQKMTITTKAIFQEKWEELKRCLMEERVEVHFYDK